MPLVTWEETESHEIECSFKYIQLCVLLMTATSAQGAPTFSTVHICIMFRGKIDHLSGSQGFLLLLLYFSSKQALLFYDLFPLHLSLCFFPYVPNHPCAQR